MNMKDRINSYLAILLITIVGSWAALSIVHVGTTDAIASTFGNSNAEQAALRQAILQGR